LARPLRPWMQLRSLGSSALNLRVHHLSTGVHAPFAPSALPRRSLASVARPGFLFRSPSRSFPFLRFFAPSAAYVVHLPYVASHRNALAQFTVAHIAAGFLHHTGFGHIQGSFALFAPLHQHLPGLFHPGATHGVLPSEVCSHPEPDTFRLALSCFPLATMATSRSRTFRPANLSITPSSVLVCRCPTRSCERPLHRTALLRRDSARVGLRLRFPRFAPLHRLSCTRTALSRARIPGIKPRTCALSRGVFYALAELAPLLAVPPSRG